MKKLGRCLVTTLATTSACAPASPTEPEPRAPARAQPDASLVTQASAPTPADSVAASPRRPPSSSASVLVPPAKPPVDIIAKVEASLAAEVVDSKSIARSSLFSWTTLAQANDIADGAPVLSKESSSTFGPSAFDWMLDAEAKRGDRLAKLLFRAGFAKKRFAWSNSYAVALGLGGERYGPVLMRVDLAPDSLIVDYPRRRVLDLSNKTVTVEELIERPGRLAAVYWEGDGFREYVLVNESKIASAHIADAEVMKRFMQDRALVSDLRSALASAERPMAAKLIERFTGSLVFQKTMTDAGVREMENGLASVGIDGVDRVVTPKATFNLGAPRPALKDDCKMMDSGDISYRRKTCQPAGRCTQAGTKCTPVKRGGIRFSD